MKGLTAKQAQMLAFIAKTIARRGYAPTFREMAAHFGVASNTVAHILWSLTCKDYIARTPNRARAIRLVAVPAPTLPPDAARLAAPVAIVDASGQVVARFWPVGQSAERVAKAAA